MADLLSIDTNILRVLWNHVVICVTEISVVDNDNGSYHTVYQWLYW